MFASRFQWLAPHPPSSQQTRWREQSSYNFCPHASHCMRSRPCISLQSHTLHASVPLLKCCNVTCHIVPSRKVNIVDHGMDWSVKSWCLVWRPCAARLQFLHRAKTPIHHFYLAEASDASCNDYLKLIRQPLALALVYLKRCHTCHGSKGHVFEAMGCWNQY